MVAMFKGGYAELAAKIKMRVLIKRKCKSTNWEKA